MHKYNKLRRCINVEDLTGKVFGKLKVIERDYTKKHKTAEYYRCECKCGNKNYIVTAKRLIEGRRSCGCIRKFKGFNDYKVNGETTTIYFTNKMDEIIMEGYIDTEDLPKLIEQNLPWSAGWDHCIQDYYAKATEYYTDDDGKRKAILHCLHREVTNAEKGTHVDHIEHKLHSSLDNRKINLRVTIHEKNSKNRKSKSSNNKSGFRNVFWDSTDERWLVMLQVNKKQTCFGRFKFEDLDKAGIRAEEARQEIYKEFAGLN